MFLAKKNSNDKYSFHTHTHTHVHTPDTAVFTVWYFVFPPQNFGAASVTREEINHKM